MTANIYVVKLYIFSKYHERYAQHLFACKLEIRLNLLKLKLCKLSVEKKHRWCTETKLLGSKIIHF